MPPEPQPGHSNWVKPILISVSVVTFIIIVSAPLFYIYKSQSTTVETENTSSQQSKELVEQAAISTTTRPSSIPSNWYTYHDEIRGIEFNFPNYWTYSSCGPDTDFMFFNHVCGSNTQPSTIIFSDSENYNSVIAQYKNGAGTKLVRQEKIQIDGKNVESFIWETKKVIVFVNNNLLTTISIQKKDFEIFDQIISSLKFIKSKNSSDSVTYYDFVACIKSKGAILYGASYSTHSQSQKDIFGEASDQVPYIECYDPGISDNTQICEDKKLTAYPTWEFKDGSRVFGKMTLLQLGLKTNCELPNENSGLNVEKYNADRFSLEVILPGWVMEKYSSSADSTNTSGYKWSQRTADGRNNYLNFIPKSTAMYNPASGDPLTSNEKVGGKNAVVHTWQDSYGFFKRYYIIDSIAGWTTCHPQLYNYLSCGKVEYYATSLKSELEQMIASVQFK